MDAVTQSQKDASLSRTGSERLQNDNAHPSGGCNEQEKKGPTLGGKTHESGSRATIKGAREPLTV